MQYTVCYSDNMRLKHLPEPEPKLQEPCSQPSVPVEGLRILARIIARRLGREKQQSKISAISDNINKNKVEHAKYRILREKKEGKR